jgi:hypothetical protein
MNIENATSEDEKGYEWRIVEILRKGYSLYTVVENLAELCTMDMWNNDLRYLAEEMLSKFEDASWIILATYCKV